MRSRFAKLPVQEPAPKSCRDWNQEWLTADTEEAMTQRLKDVKMTFNRKQDTAARISLSGGEMQ